MTKRFRYYLYVIVFMIFRIISVFTKEDNTTFFVLLFFIIIELMLISDKIKRQK